MTFSDAYGPPDPEPTAFQRWLEDDWPEFRESDPDFDEQDQEPWRAAAENRVERFRECDFHHGVGLTVCDSAALYRPRHPEESVLYGVVAGQLETFLDGQRRRERTVPRFVERELRSFLECGVLAHGFLRVRCEDCGRDRVVAFSCKGRGFCPSCGGRRMADTAAHLVDRVFPEVPVRQWVLSLPFSLRYRLAYDAHLVGDVLRVFVQAVFGSLRRRARSRGAGRDLKCGAVTFVQRFGDALNLNVHFHMLALDGTYEREDGQLPFRPLPVPTDGEVARVTARVVRRVTALLERRGLDPRADPEETDPLRRDEPGLAELYGASVSGRIATGPRAGRRVATLGDRRDVEDFAPGPGCANVSGFNVHANVCVPAYDRFRVERLCRYVGRPPLATERLSWLPEGRLLYRLKRRWRNGTTHLLLEPLQLVEKLAALVPPPRFHRVRYHGVLAPASRWRPQVVPSASPEVHPIPHPGCQGQSPTQEGLPAEAGPQGPPKGRPRNYSWSELMHRVFVLDVLECSDCGGRLRIVAAIHPPEAIRKILDCLGLLSRPPPVALAQSR